MKYINMYTIRISKIIGDWILYCYSSDFVIYTFTQQIPDNPPDYKTYYRHMNKVLLY